MVHRARLDVVAYVAHPAQLWSILASANSLERPSCEIKRRAEVVQILPNDAGIMRLIGAGLLEHRGEWQVVRRQVRA